MNKRNSIKLLLALGVFVLIFSGLILHRYREALNLNYVYLKVSGTESPLSVQGETNLGAIVDFAQNQNLIWTLPQNENRALVRIMVHAPGSAADSSLRIALAESPRPAYDESQLWFRPHSHLLVEHGEVSASQRRSILPAYHNVLNWKGDVRLVLSPLLVASLITIVLIAFLFPQAAAEAREWIGSILGKCETPFYWLYLIAFPLYGLFRGVDLTDVPYVLNHYRFFPETNPLFYLSSMLGNLWIKLAGNGILASRILYLILLWSMMLIIYSALMRKVPRRILLQGLVVMMSSIVTASAYSPSLDSLSLLLLLAQFVCISGYLEQGRSGMLVVYGLVSGLLTLVRFPGIATIGIPFIIWAVMLIESRWSRTPLRSVHPARDALFLLLPFACVIASFLLFAPGYSLTAVWDAITHLLANDRNHSLDAITSMYAHDFQMYVRNFIFLGVGCGVFALLRRFPSIVRWAFLLLFYAWMVWYVWANRGPHIPFGMVAFFSCGILLLLLVMLLHLEWHRYRFIVLTLLVGFVFVFVPILGSATGFFKMRLFLSVYAVFLWALMHRVAADGNRVGYFKPFFGVFVLVLVLSSLVFRLGFVYGDTAPVRTMTEYSSLPQLHGIRISQVRKHYLEDTLDRLCRHVGSSQDLVLYGRPGHMFYYLLQRKSPVLQNFELDCDSVHLQVLEQFFAEGHLPVIGILHGEPHAHSFLPPNPLSPPKPTEDQKKLIDMLQQRGYRIVEETGYMVLLLPETSLAPHMPIPIP